MPKSIVIVGGGVIGLCTAYYALQRGHAVTILERGAPDHDGCSLGNAGMVVPSHFVPLAAPGMPALGLRMLFNPESPFYIQPRLDPALFDWAWKFLLSSTAGHVARSGPLLRDLNLRSRRAYEALSAEWGDSFGLAQRGLLMLCKSAQTLHDEIHVAEAARALGLAAHVLSADDTAQLDPGVRADVAGSVYFPQDCHLDPARFVAGLTQKLMEGGARFVWEAELTGWERRGAGIDAARTTAGEFSGDEYVIAGGSWSPEIGAALDLALPMQPGKGYSFTVPAPRQLPEICSIFVEARVAVTPMGGSLRFGGTMEITDLANAGEINPRRVNGIKKSIPAYFPDFRAVDFEGLPVWTGLRPCSPDGLPYLGRFRDYPNLSAATGHSMMGLSLGPVTGLLMAQILSDETPEINVAALSPDRFRATF
jgi:D-amino-acid dehydrogenase